MGKKMTAALIAAYGRSLRGRERSPGTVEKYLRDIGAFSRWLGGGTVSGETAARWKAHLVEAGYAPATVNSMLAAVNGLFRFLGWEDCRTRALRVQRRMFREPGRELTRADYERLLRAARERGLQRLELLMETLCATGIRVGELGYITVEAAKKRRAEIALKGKIRVILLPGKLSRKLLSYAGKQKTASGAIFRTGSGRQLGRRQVWAELKALCRPAGVEPAKVFPHNFRHLFARVFYKASRDIAKLADLLGHSSLETTRLYLADSGAEHLRQLERLGLVT